MRKCSRFGPPVPREAHMSVAPMRFLFSQKLVSLQERKQDAKSGAYKRVSGADDYERFRARLLYVNNPRVCVQSFCISFPLYIVSET